MTFLYSTRSVVTTRLLTAKFAARLVLFPGAPRSMALSKDPSRPTARGLTR